MVVITCELCSGMWPMYVIAMWVMQWLLGKQMMLMECGFVVDVKSTWMCLA